MKKAHEVTTVGEMLEFLNKKAQSVGVRLALLSVDDSERQEKVEILADMAELAAAASVYSKLVNKIEKEG